MTEFEVLHHLGRVRGRCRHDEMRLAQPGAGAVIHHKTILAQHQAITRAANGKVGPAIGVDTFQKLRGIGSLNVDLSQRCHIAEADGAAHRVHLPLHGGKPVLAQLREILRPQP